MLLKLFPVSLLVATMAFAQNEAAARRELALLERIEQLEKRVNELEARAGVVPPKPAAPPVASPPAPGKPAVDFLHGTTVNFLVDGYYGYNFNNPIGRANLLRAYDVLSNAFSLNQAAVVIENAPDLTNGKRWGARLDLQFGQATETLQGNPANEPRPDIYRNLFQVYGTYVFPLGSGLTVDFGKFGSSLGIENNYTKDEINYSRSFWFDFLPFYHMGVRANYQLTKSLALNYWNAAYYFGQEHPDTVYFPNGRPSNLPALQGLPFEPIANAPSGHLHIFDSYASWQASPKLLLAAEGDYVIERLFTYSTPDYTYGGAGYLRYQLTPKFAVASRAEYLGDHGGLFSGATQALKETTFTTEYKFGEGFLMRGEWRRDFSNHPYFLTDTLGILKKEQNTATVGLVWWFGAKQGAW